MAVHWRGCRRGCHGGGGGAARKDMGGRRPQAPCARLPDTNLKRVAQPPACFVSRTQEGNHSSAGSFSNIEHSASVALCHGLECVENGLFVNGRVRKGPGNMPHCAVGSHCHPCPQLSGLKDWAPSEWVLIRWGNCHLWPVLSCEHPALQWCFF